jgi:hypothetical protein
MAIVCQPFIYRRGVGETLLRVIVVYRSAPRSHGRKKHIYVILRMAVVDVVIAVRQKY